MKLKPGETAPKTCTCSVCDKKGNKINTVDIKKGKTLPPTPKSKEYYDL